MRIAILWDGGGMFGGCLCRSDHDLTVIDVARPAVDTIKARCLAVEEKDEPIVVVNVPATDADLDALAEAVKKNPRSMGNRNVAVCMAYHRAAQGWKEATGTSSLSHAGGSIEFGGGGRVASPAKVI